MKTGLTWTLILFCLLVAIGAQAVKKPELKFLKPVELPNIGLKIELMPDSREIPLPPPTVYTYTFTKGNTSWKTNMYSPFELWQQSQHAGKWVDPNSNTLVIATITQPLPKGFAGEHVVKKDYEKKIAGAGISPEKWTAKELSQWVADFTGAKSAHVQAMHHNFNLKNLVKFRLEGEPNKRMAYAFRLNPSASGQYNAVPTWFFVLLDVNPSLDPAKAQKTIYEKFFTAVTTSRTSKKQVKGPSEEFQQEHLLSLAERSPEFLAGRRQVANSIRNMKDWWFVETENYIILSNLGTRYRIMVKELQSHIECLRTAYEQLIPPRKEIRDVSVIRVFATPEEYLNYVDAEHQWSSGLWMPSKKELVIRPIDWGGSKDQRERVLRITYHEAFHQYIFYALDQIQTSVWFNEGHAVLFENATLRNKKLTIGEDEEKVKTLEEMIGSGFLDIKKMLNMSYADFYAKDDETRKQNYALAWAIVYYLRKGATLDHPNHFASVLKSYVNALWRIKNAEAATAATFRAIDMDRFHHAFINFWKSKNMRVKARKNRIF